MSPWLIVSGDFVRTGGMDRANYALAEHLARAGEQVHLVTHRADPALAAAGARVHTAPKPLGSYLLGEPGLGALGRAWAAWVQRQGGRAVANGGSCLGAQVNWVHYLHAAYDPRAAGLKARLHRRRALSRERRAIRGAGLVIANSRQTARAVVDRLGVPEARVRVVHYGIDPELFRPADMAQRRAARVALGWPADRPVLLFVGALGDRRKGFDVALAAWRRLCADPDWDADLAVVGAGRALTDWRRRVVEQGLDARVRLLGFRRDVPQLLAAADGLVAPTRYEAYGLAVHEALCCGLAAFVSADAGVAERYPPALEPLLLPDPDDADDLAARLRRWRQDPGALRTPLEELSSSLRARTWDAMAAELVGLCREWA